jgi:hypothetical protein
VLPSFLASPRLQQVLLPWDPPSAHFPN